MDSQLGFDRPPRRRRIRQRRIDTQQEKILRKAREMVEEFENPLFADMYLHAVEKKVFEEDDIFLEFLAQLEQPPVSIHEFLDSTDFLAATDLVLWPEVRQAIIDINENWWKGPKHAIQEALLMGATSTGKSEIAKVTLAYHVHLLHCLRQPQLVYGLPSSTSIIFVIQAAKPHVTKRILYTPLRVYIEAMPWFQKYARPTKHIEAEMFFTDKNIRVVQGGSDADAILGEAIIGGAVDEVNFMQVVEQSKRAEVSEGGRGGRYDQAQNLHDTLTRRRKGRFMYNGPSIGLISLSSSTRYRNDFTDRRKAQIEDGDLQGCYIYDKAQYEVWPQDRYCGDKFRLLIENEAAADVRILEPEERAAEGATVIEIPVEYRENFEIDSAGALRDVVGRSVKSINPFLRRREKVNEAVIAGQEMGLESFLVKDNVILGLEGMPLVTRGHYCQSPSRPRYIHIDLSSTGDRCGIAMVRFDGFTDVVRVSGETETLPIATCEMAVTILPNRQAEIEIGEVRAWVRQLKVTYGYPIRGITYDGWNSLESRQQWKRQGMRTGLQSVDRTCVPYKNLRDAIYDGRLRLYYQDILVDELISLEYDEKREKVEHPPKGSKDVADALCGAYWLLLGRSKTWESYAEVGEREDLGERFEGEARV